MEIEAKFAVTDDALAKRLKAVEAIDGLVLAPSVTTRVHDTYLDTQDRRLLAAGYACRQRRAARDAALIVTIKQITNESTAIHTREELEIVLSEDAPPMQWQDSPARERVLSIIGDAPLRKLFELHQTRVKRDVMKTDSPIAEWSVDEVRVRARNRHLKFAELEIELKPDGTPEDLVHLAARTQAEWNLAPETKSKFERVLAWIDESRATPQRRRRVPKIRLDDPMAEAARKTLLLHWGRMLDHEAGAREGADSEQVHDMRVATRRMRAALRVFSDYIGADAFKPFTKMLRRTARALGAVRDLDVFREKAQHYLDTLPDERKAELDPLLAAWQTEYQRARAELIALFDSNAFARFKIAFEEFLRVRGAGAATPETNDGAPRAQRVRDALPIILLREWATVRAYDESVSVPDVPLTRLHQLRIASKGLRYTLEFFADVLGPDVQPLVEQMKQLQDHLGNLQDAVVACNHLRDFLTWGEWSHAAPKFSRRPRALIVAPGVAAYLAARQTEIRELVRNVPQVWAPISHSKFKNQLLTLLAAW